MAKVTMAQIIKAILEGRLQYGDLSIEQQYAVSKELGISVYATPTALHDAAVGYLQDKGISTEGADSGFTGISPEDIAKLIAQSATKAAEAEKTPPADYAQIILGQGLNPDDYHSLVLEAY